MDISAWGTLRVSTRKVHPLTNDADRAKRLGDLLVRRRIELNPAWRNRRAFVARYKLSYRITNDLERGHWRDFEPVTVTAFEVAYELAPGSLNRSLHSGELEPITRPRPEPPGRLQLKPGMGGQFTLSRERDAAQAAGPPMGPIVRSVREDIAEALARAGIRGCDIFMDEDEARLWDDTDRLPVDSRAEMIATLRRIRLEEEPGNPGHLLPRRAG